MASSTRQSNIAIAEILCLTDCGTTKLSNPPPETSVTCPLTDDGNGKAARRSGASLRMVGTGVLLEVLLRNAVEGERGDRALQERSRHAPRAAGAAPAAEVVAVDPDESFVHGTCLCVSGSVFRL